MKTIDFAKHVQKSIVMENNKIYRDLFENTEPQNITDDYWKNVLKFYQNLSREHKEVFFDIIKQVSIDTLSNLFAVIDGVAPLENVDLEFKLTASDGEAEILSGDLQDIFLELQEHEGL